VALVALLVNVGGNALFVPRLGSSAAAAVTLATELTVLVGSLIVLTNSGARVPLTRGLIATPLAAGAALALGTLVARVLAP